jgi:hypothetical protein
MGVGKWKLGLMHLSHVFNKIGEQEGKTGSAWKGRRKVAQTMYTHMSNCKNDKINFFKIKNKVYTNKQTKDEGRAGCWWFTPVILATWEAEIRRLWFKASSGQYFERPPSPK